MTETGRRTGLLFGSSAMVVTVVAGVVGNGPPATVALYGAGGGIIFGAVGLMIGNLFEGFVTSAARKEAERLALEKELAKRMALEQMNAMKSAKGGERSKVSSSEVQGG